METMKNRYERFIQIVMEQCKCDEKSAREAWTLYGENLDLCRKYVKSKQ